MNTKFEDIENVCEKLNRLSLAISRYKRRAHVAPLMKLEKPEKPPRPKLPQIHASRFSERLAREEQNRKLEANAYNDYEKADEIYEKTADPGTGGPRINPNLKERAAAFQTPTQPTIEPLKPPAPVEPEFPKTGTAKSFLAPINNFRPGQKTEAPKPPNIPLPPVPTNSGEPQQLPRQPITHNKPAAPRSPSLTSLEKMHLEIQLRARNKGSVK